MALREVVLDKVEKLRKINKAKQIIILISLLSLCLDAYRIVGLGTFSVTLSFLSLIALIFVGLLEMDNGLYPDKKRLFICALFALAIVISVLFNLRIFNANSTMLYVVFLLVYLFSHHRTSDANMLKILWVVNIVYTALSLYGIYQFGAYMYDLPLADIIIPGHMTPGFNRTNTIEIGDYRFTRAHSIYLEPSALSQFAAFAIILSFILFKYKLLKFYVLIPCVLINIIALIMAIAGTGIIVLGVTVLIFSIMCIVKRKYIFVPIGVLVLIIAAIFFIFLTDNNISEYVRTRIMEIMDPKWSGGMRFTTPYLVAHWSVTHYYLGVSPGNEAFAIQQYRSFHPYSGIMSAYDVFPSGYAKVAVELGIFGFGLLCALFSTLRKNSFYKYIFAFVLMIPFIGGNLLQPYLWVLVALLNSSPREWLIYERTLSSWQTSEIAEIAA